MKYPKRDAKWPFITWSEIERIVSRGGLTAGEEYDLWDCLFLNTDEVGCLSGLYQDTSMIVCDVTSGHFVRWTGFVKGVRDK
tara:strand:+ start:105078 stop:105323 length:246 start_codon:yes stop_codon:yes gene_type:complete